MKPTRTLIGGLALAMAIGSFSCAEPPAVDQDALYVRDVSDGIHNTTPVRGEPQLAFFMDGDPFSCSICHEGFTGELQEQALKGQHARLHFDHGRNLDCMYCHNRNDADAYIDHDGSIIPADEPNRLCAKCHGPQYRYWNLGVHGRRGPYWNATMGDVTPLDCIQCHDPHRPKFQPMSPEPGPRLSRMDPPAVPLAPHALEQEHEEGNPNE